MAIPHNSSDLNYGFNGSFSEDSVLLSDDITAGRSSVPSIISNPEAKSSNVPSNDGSDVLVSNGQPTSDGASFAITIVIPVVLLLLLIILTFAARRSIKRFSVRGRMRSNTAHGVEGALEEEEPLKPNESNKEDMQIVQETGVLSSRSDSVESKDRLESQDDAKPPPVISSQTQSSVPPANGIIPQIHVQLNLPTLERPKTLKFLAASVAFQNTTVPAVKRLPYTPDPDCVLTDGPYSPEKEAINEERDKIAPLCKGMKTRSKPRGLLERRGSNVALTISLRTGEKPSATNPLTAKSPKPLAYLQQASSPLAPEAIHSKACDTSGLQQEFWEIPMNHPSEKNFNVAGHGTKNRYRTILPNEHSRVTLSPSSDDDPLSTYINANFIRNCTKVKTPSQKAEHMSSPVTRENAAFIATQGPMANTIEDFWRMIWQEQARSVVMITKLKERKEKCSLYLPMAVGESEVYDELTVVVHHIKKLEHFAIRTLELTHSCGQKRVVNHFWYTTWMDHETPEKTRGLLELVQEVCLWKRDDHGPIIVHCSAGIGRTGCFIAVSVGCEELRNSGKVDILRIVSQMRLDRGGMIQTWEQYQFVHQALSRYARVLAGENVTTPSTTGSVRSPPLPPSKAPSSPAHSDAARPGTPKHRRSLTSNDLPAAKGPKVCQTTDANHVASPPSPDRPRTSKKKSALRLAKVRDVTPPTTPGPGKEATVAVGAVAKSASSPAIRSPLARLCLQAKDMNRNASPLSSVKFEWPQPSKPAASADGPGTPRTPTIPVAENENGAENNCREVSDHAAASPSAKLPTLLAKQQFSFDLQATRPPNALVRDRNGKEDDCVAAPGKTSSVKTSTPTCTSMSSSHFVFPVPDAR